MDINNNAELSNKINNLIKESGIKKIVLAEKMGIVNQNLNRKINKKKFIFRRNKRHHKPIRI